MKKNIIIIILSLISLIPNSVWALEATPSAVSEDEVKEKVKEILEEIKDVIPQEKENQLYAWVGKIEKAEDNKLTIQTKIDLREAKIATNAAIYFFSAGKSKKTIKAEDIETEQFIIAMGTKLEDKLILAKRIITMDEAPKNGAKRDLLTGKVSEIDEDTITVKKNGDSFKITLDKEVSIQINDIKKPTVEDIHVDDNLTALVALDKEGNIESVKSVLVVPGKTNPQAVENEATAEDVQESTPPAETEAEPEEE